MSFVRDLFLDIWWEAFVREGLVQRLVFLVILVEMTDVNSSIA